MSLSDIDKEFTINVEKFSKCLKASDKLKGDERQKKIKKAEKLLSRVKDIQSEFKEELEQTEDAPTTMEKKLDLHQQIVDQCTDAINDFKQNTQQSTDDATNDDDSTTHSTTMSIDVENNGNQNYVYNDDHEDDGESVLLLAPASKKRTKKKKNTTATDNDIKLSNLNRAKQAKNAFENRDPEASKALHQATSVTESGHQRGGDYIKSVVYGAMDGIITTFAVVSAVVGGNLAIGTVLIMGFANMLGDGISMGMGDFLSSRAETKFAMRERERECWEVDNDLDEEKREMIELYEMKPGISHDDAVTIVDIISKDKNTFVDIMMVEELGLMPPDPDESHWKNGLATFLAFIVFGTIPLIPYCVAIAIEGPTERAALDFVFAIAIAMTGLTMFGLGALTSRFTPESWIKAGFFTFFNGATAALLSYAIAVAVSKIFGVEL